MKVSIITRIIYLRKIRKENANLLWLNSPLSDRISRSFCEAIFLFPFSRRDLWKFKRWQVIILVLPNISFVPHSLLIVGYLTDNVSRFWKRDWKILVSTTRCHCFIYEGVICQVFIKSFTIFWQTIFLNYACIEEILWRVWSWLRMNVGGVPKVCKSRENHELAREETGKRLSNA